MQTIATIDAQAKRLLADKNLERETLVASLRDLKPVKLQIQQATAEKEKAEARATTLRAELAELQRLLLIKKQEVEQADVTVL